MQDQSSIIHKDTSTVVRAVGLQNEAGAYVNDATSVQLTDMVDRDTNVQVSGLSLPLNMNYVIASNGNYEAIIPHGVGVEVGRTYVATFKAVGPTGDIQKVWKETVRCRHAIG